MITPVLKSPFPYFGGKSRIAADVWQRFGVVENYVEPFFGSGAVLLGNPSADTPLETVNDLNSWLCNFWRALQIDPDGVAHHADWPVSELDLHARGDWLFYRPDVREFIEQLRADPDYYDSKSAGWWVWGISSWIGSGWDRNEKRAVVKAQIPDLGSGKGVNRKRPLLGGNGGFSGINATIKSGGLYSYMQSLSTRLRRVRVCCGDWTRVLGPSVTFVHGLTAVFLDPPYSAEAGRNKTLYGAHDDLDVAHDVREWALANGDNILLRIALCGYAEEHDAYMPDNWERLKWKTAGGYGSQSDNGVGRDNAKRECIWFSPNCMRQATLF